MKEILLTVKEKYAEGLMSKSDKTRIKQLLKTGKIRQASIYLGEVLSKAISANGDIILDENRKKTKKKKT